MSNIEIMFLGTAQDGSIPHANCECSTCLPAYSDISKRRLASCLMVSDKKANKWYMLDATPDFTIQLFNAKNHLNSDKLMDGIFLTHGHIGHYGGMMFLGKESIDANNVDLYVGEKLNNALSKSIPFSFLYENNNIVPNIIKEEEVKLTDDLSITPLIVPHRNEVGETFGFYITTPESKTLFIPDIDDYKQMNIPILELINDVDLLIMDATFYKKDELKVRDYSKIPHPTIQESIQMFENVSDCKIIFTHFNHTNMIFKEKDILSEVEEKGFIIAQDNDIINLSNLN